MFTNFNLQLNNEIFDAIGLFLKGIKAKEAENLIKLLRKDSHKINAYILCGKLRSAYLMAVKAERVEDVQRIAGAAQRMGQTAVKNICNKWLEQKKNT
ncbi:zinc finger FYVE domain-containing protein 26 [Mytilus galloprovincialis]|uniref:Zinc finger FYVE domain-containing protein 26 n=1 Tax=Mytilus galloprovincialis TaxID=29158 RepID=A0A8B6HH54_MYTGA|nr:zinc finger FYVE domain-containing protein 26 [Mytilus galloprovincialis]